MRLIPALVASTLLVALASSCGKNEQGSIAGEGGDAAGLAGASHDSPCDASNAFPVWGKRYLSERGCIDTETPIELAICNVVPADNAREPYPDAGFHCIRRLADDAVFWAFAFNDLDFDATQYELCDSNMGRPPPPCYAEGCPDAPPSSCSLSQTRRAFACNAEGGYDEGCCGRPSCDENEDCPPSEECRSVSVGGMMQCWDNPGNSCDCAGPLLAYMDRRCVPLPTEPEALGTGCENCTRRPIGEPTWQPGQALIFVADIGAPETETGSQAFFDWQAEFFGSRHIYSAADGIFLPGDPHEGPYDSELSTLADEAALVPAQAFSVEEFTDPSGLVLLIAVVPGPQASSGRSPDFEDGPIITNEVFPIIVTGGVYRNREPFDLDFDSNFFAYDQLSTPIDADGPSHFFMGFGENSAFGPSGVDPVGSYSFRVRAIDSVGEGWEIEVPFRIGE